MRASVTWGTKRQNKINKNIAFDSEILNLFQKMFMRNRIEGPSKVQKDYVS